MIIRLVGGEMADAEERDVRQHLAACPICAQAFQELRGTWDDLGTWEVHSTDTDLTDRVLNQVREEENPIRHPLLMVVVKASQLRVAASIALAAGLGVATGALVPRDRALQGSQPPSIPAAAEVAEALGLTELATPSATGLPLGFEPEAADDAGVGP